MGNNENLIGRDQGVRPDTIISLHPSVEAELKKAGIEIVFKDGYIVAKRGSEELKYLKLDHYRNIRVEKHGEKFWFVYQNKLAPVYEDLKIQII